MSSRTEQVITGLGFFGAWVAWMLGEDVAAVLSGLLGVGFFIKAFFHKDPDDDLSEHLRRAKDESEKPKPKPVDPIPGAENGRASGWFSKVADKGDSAAPGEAEATVVFVVGVNTVVMQPTSKPTEHNPSGTYIVMLIHIVNRGPKLSLRFRLDDPETGRHMGQATRFDDNTLWDLPEQLKPLNLLPQALYEPHSVDSGVEITGKLHFLFDPKPEEPRTLPARRLQIIDGLTRTYSELDLSQFKLFDLVAYPHFGESPSASDSGNTGDDLAAKIQRATEEAHAAQHPRGPVDPIPGATRGRAINVTGLLPEDQQETTITPGPFIVGRSYGRGHFNEAGTWISLDLRIVNRGPKVSLTFRLVDGERELDAAGEVVMRVYGWKRDPPGFRTFFPPLQMDSGEEAQGSVVFIFDPRPSEPRTIPGRKLLILDSIRQQYMEFDVSEAGLFKIEATAPSLPESDVSETLSVFEPDSGSVSLHDTRRTSGKRNE